MQKGGTRPASALPAFGRVQPGPRAVPGDVSLGARGITMARRKGKVPPPYALGALSRPRNGAPQCGQNCASADAVAAHLRHTRGL
jgi:hypothetical protein